MPPLVAAAAAWSERFAMFAVVAFAGALISLVVAPALVAYLAPFAVLCVLAAGAFWAIPSLYARHHARLARPTAAAEADPRLALRAALLRARGRVSPALAERLRRVRATIDAGLDHADKTSTGDLDTHILRESALHYVPEAIDYYLSLPANAPRTLEGRTPEQELDYQLGLIEERVQKVLDGKARELVDDFEAHGRFLRERLSSGAGLARHLEQRRHHDRASRPRANAETRDASGSAHDRPRPVDLATARSPARSEHRVGAPDD